jgi:hypothetical protein
MVEPLTLALEQSGSSGRIDAIWHTFEVNLCRCPHDKGAAPWLAVMACKLAIDSFIRICWGFLDTYLSACLGYKVCCLCHYLGHPTISLYKKIKMSLRDA